MAGLQFKFFMRYQNMKRLAKANDLKFRGKLSMDDVKKICGGIVPEWISYPEYEEVKWLNKQLSKCWPFIDEATKAIIRAVELVLEEYRPPEIKSLKFRELSLGTNVPKIKGIRVQSLQNGQITMDIKFDWLGDPNIILAVEAEMGYSIPVKLDYLQVHTVIRVIFQLAAEIPISAVVVTLLSEIVVIAIGARVTDNAQGKPLLLINDSLEVDCKYMQSFSLLYRYNVGIFHN